MTGWFSLERDIFKHDFFKREPFTEREAWIWIISKAVWEDTTFDISGVNHPIPRGSFVTTLSELEATWTWSSTRIRNYLKKLVDQHMIKHEVFTRKTLLSVCNYDLYQKNVNNGRENKHDAKHELKHEKNTQNNNIINTTTTSGSDFSNSSPFSDPIVQRMFEALGSPPELKREMNTPHSWLELECDLEADILPTLRMMAQRQS